MEDKRGTKRSRFLSMEGSPSPGDAKTHPSAPSGSPPPPGSQSEISSCRPCSPVFEQGRPSKKASMIDLSSSSDEEDFIAATSRLSSPKDSLASSTVISWGRPTTVISSSSVTPIKRRCARRRLPTLKLWLLLLQSTLPQPPPSMPLQA
jgi:hypothetical protein